MCIEANDTNHALDNPLSLILQSFKRNIKTSMAIDDKIQDEKLRHGINIETTKLFAYSYYNQAKLIPINTLQMKKYYCRIKVE